MRLSFALPKICTRKEVSALYCLRSGKNPLPLSCRIALCS
mgnify:FL=1